MKKLNFKNFGGGVLKTHNFLNYGLKNYFFNKFIMKSIGGII